MQKKTLSAIVAVLAVAVIAVAGFYFKKQKGGGETISTAYDLSSKAGALPDGWYVNSYEDQYQVYGDENGVITLQSDIVDDLRLCKKVTVQEGSLYVLTGYIATEGVANGRGASLSIDNYSLDKSCVYTQGLQGDNDFTETKLYFETKPGQTEIILALRLGGYSEASSGTVRFKDVSLRSGTADEGRYQLLEAWGGSSNDDDDDAFRDEEHYKSFFAVIVWAAVLSGVLLIFGIYRNRKLLTGRTLPEKGYWGGFAFIVVVGLLLRLILCALYRGHDSDMGCFIGWGQDIARNGTRQFYWAAGHDWYDYPPGYMLFLGGYSAVLNLFRVDTGTVLGIFLYMLPAIAADLFLSLLLVSFARKQRINNAGALILGGLVFLNPALLFLTGAWGQIDSILTLWLVVSFLLLLDPKPGTVDRNRILSGAVFGLAVMTKWQALMFGPVYAMAHLFLVRWGEKEAGKDLRDTVLSALAAFAVILLISLPFKGDQGLFWFVDRFMTASAHYDYATVEAYNYFAFCGANWKRAGEYILPGLLTFKQFGTVAILLAILCGFMTIRRRRQAQKRLDSTLSEDKGFLFLAASLIMALIFTFGHYMHERYVVPILVMLLFAYAFYKDRRLLLIALLFTVTTFLNEMMAQYVVSNAAMSIVRGGREHNTVLRFWSGAEVLVCLSFGFVVVDMLHDLRGKLGLFLDREEEKGPSKLYSFIEEGLEK
ncbi:MAG: hypothetical protein IKE11_03845 [Clostridia bacterium]|nr:hypothetical protein [Clostridia bacterium]